MLFNYHDPTIKSIYYPKFKLSMLITNLYYQLYKFLCNQYNMMDMNHAKLIITEENSCYMVQKF